MIKTVNLTKIFRTDEVETTALNKVQMEISNGEYNALGNPEQAKWEDKKNRFS